MPKAVLNLLVKVFFSWIVVWQDGRRWSWTRVVWREAFTYLRTWTRSGAPVGASWPTGMRGDAAARRSCDCSCTDDARSPTECRPTAPPGQPRATSNKVSAQTSAITPTPKRRTIYVLIFCCLGYHVNWNIFYFLYHCSKRTHSVCFKVGVLLSPVLRNITEIINQRLWSFFFFIRSLISETSQRWLAQCCGCFSHWWQLLYHPDTFANFEE